MASAAERSDRYRGRREARRVALTAVFEADFGQHTADSVLERELERVSDPSTAELARLIVAAVVRNRDQLDVQISAAAPKYPVLSMAPMDRALLRCGLGEVLHSPTPARVAIAEWVELARIYSGDPMRRLLNGVLGRIAAESTGAESPKHSSEEGVRGHDVRPAEEDRRRTARGGRGRGQAGGVVRRRSER
jgi:N utilization substance protein B